MHMKNQIITGGIGASTFLAMALAASTSASQTTPLYQGSGASTPESQLSLFPVTIGATVSSSNGATTLDTTNSFGLQDGYYNTSPITLKFVNLQFPDLNPADGFTVGLDVQINTESHTINTSVNSNRAGFGLIDLGDDKKGIELEFWGDDVWVQNSDFTHGEDFVFNTEAASHHYDLTVKGTTYTLSADNTQILTGSTRDYSARGAPYTLPNYISIGDDTAEAEAKETFTTLSVTVPEPGTASAILAIGAAMLSRRRRPE